MHHQPLTTEESEFSCIARFPPKERPLSAAKLSVTQETPVPSARQEKVSKEHKESVQNQGWNAGIQ